MNVLAVADYLLPPGTQYVFLVFLGVVGVALGVRQILRAEYRRETVVGVVVCVCGVIVVLISLGLFNSHSENVGVIRSSGDSGGSASISGW